MLEGDGLRLSYREAMRKVPTKRPPRRSLLPRRTVRLRLTALYGVMFLFSGAIVLGIASGVVVARSTSVAVSSTSQAVPQTPLERADARIQMLQQELASASSRAPSGVKNSLIVGSLIALGIMTLISVLLGWLVAGRALRPLRQMTAATRRISADSLDERLAVTGPDDEMKDLADTIDGLLERLEGAFAAQRRFVANASHELRTPLTTMRASLDVAVAKPDPVPPSTIALAGGCAPSSTGSTSCWKACWCWPGRSTASCPGGQSSRSNPPPPRPWPPGPPTSPPGASPCSTSPAREAPGSGAASRCCAG